MLIKVFKRNGNGTKGKLLGEREFPDPFTSEQDPTGSDDKSTWRQVAQYARDLFAGGTLVERSEGKAKGKA